MLRMILKLFYTLNCQTVLLIAKHNRYRQRAKELAHLEMIGDIVYQLTKDLSVEEIKKSGFDQYFVDHTIRLFYHSLVSF